MSIPPPDFLKHLREICDKSGALLIADEVQTGLGRTGAWWGFSDSSVAPDIVAMGKAIGGGSAARRHHRHQAARRTLADRLARQHLWRQSGRLSGRLGDDSNHQRR